VLRSGQAVSLKPGQIITIKTDLQELGCGVMDWMELVQDRDSWWELVTGVMIFRIPYIEGIFLIQEYLLASLESICSVE
jgi:hypothetical protein